ncbi:MAG TPA: PepSY-associated TM helix domain-containing protein [Ohtaekwangia sp.]|uniref:PepSY-associated TM helix domain-containing protein n=1 Tax=Ohtaekwangia sp. TaxID=2066019 RepID=UPI002F92201E
MIRIILLFLHRWLGIISGLIVFVVSITGATFVFEEELFRVFHKEAVYVTPGKQPLDINVLKAAAQESIGKDKTINFVFMYEDANRAYCFSALERDAKSKSLWDKDEIKYYYQVFVNPYTGKVQAVVNKETEFFYTVRRIHQNLLLRRGIGNMIVGSAVLIFVFILISGIILWWPQRVAAWKQRVTIKWKARWRRVNYDLHSVLGFYIFLVALLIATTGLAWSFEWWEHGIVSMMGSSKKELAFLTERDSVNIPSAEGVTRAWQDSRKRYDHFNRMTFTFPSKKNNRVQVFIQYKGASAWTDSDYIFYNSADGTVQQAIAHSAKPMALQWRNSNYDIHTGKIYGWPSQVLALIASLICASLPVTGVIIWLGRKKKKAIPKSAGVRNRVVVKAA